MENGGEGSASCRVRQRNAPFPLMNASFAVKEGYDKEEKREGYGAEKTAHGNFSGAWNAAFNPGRGRIFD